MQRPTGSALRFHERTAGPRRGTCVLTEAPSQVDLVQLRDLGLRIRPEKCG
jgi:hypothetical protein